MWLLRTGTASASATRAALPFAASSLLRGSRPGARRAASSRPAAAHRNVPHAARGGSSSSSIPAGGTAARRMSTARALPGDDGERDAAATVGDAFLADGDFESLGCSTELSNALRGSGFKRPTTVQV
jgi:hypothetical protein